MDNSEYLSKEGFVKLQKELKVLSKQKRKEIASRLEQAIALGDISENAEYQEAKEAQTANEMRIAELEDLLQRAEIISEDRSRGQVDIGVKVVTQKSGIGELLEFAIVGPEEADPLTRKISYESPIGRALMGKKKGEEVSVHTPKGTVTYKIVDIA